MNNNIIRTPDEINTFLNKLKTQIESVSSLDAAIRAIEGKYTEDDCWNKYELEVWNDEQRWMSIEAVLWMEGDNDGSSLIEE